jgi:hypothetical protein
MRNGLRIQICLCVLTLFCMIVFSWQFGVGLRFESPRLNIITLLISLALPTLSWVLLWGIKSHLLRSLALLVITPVALTSIAILVLLIMDTNSCASQFLSDDSCNNVYELERLKINGGVITATLIRDNTLSWPEIYVQQHRTIMPGLDWVDTLCNVYKASKVDIKPLGVRQILCKFTLVDGSRTDVLTIR